ncbi:hypothetical protein NDU88_004090 [Pleurodeles waltl]|uniref:Uncharacterized protein n=1 Tax=Pleurodeles waltl TaxID=8319 RepID=A0AAV7T735_PLEWA|nr:hypothetical protein NDU88_004090 [Pleurodeles waltl]
MILVVKTLEGKQRVCGIASYPVGGYKAVIRGQVQALIGGIKKDQLIKVEVLEAEIRALEMAAVQRGRPCPERCHQLRLCQQELRDLADGRTRVHVLATQGRLYDIGYKANKLIAWLGRRDRVRNGVVTVRDAARKECRTSGDIAEAFAEYYKRLYESRVEFTGDEMRRLLRGCFSVDPHS